MDLNKLRGVLAEKRITQVKLAKALHLSVKSMNAKLNGKTPITVEEANMIAKIADISNPTEIFFADSVAKMLHRGDKMKLTLTLDEVSAVTQALLSKAQEAEEEALGCEKLRCASAAEFWQKRAELYRKTFEAVKAQRASWWEEARRQ